MLDSAQCLGVATASVQQAAGLQAKEKNIVILALARSSPILGSEKRICGVFLSEGGEVRTSGSRS